MEFIHADEVTEDRADPRVFVGKAALPDGVEGDDTVQLQHGVFVLQGTHFLFLGVAEVDTGRKKGSGVGFPPAVFVGLLR